MLNTEFFYSQVMLVGGMIFWSSSSLTLSWDTGKVLQRLQENSFAIMSYISFSNINAVAAKNTNAAPKISITWGMMLVNRIWATNATRISVVRSVATVAGATILHDLNSNRNPNIPSNRRNIWNTPMNNLKFPPMKYNWSNDLIIYDGT